MQAPALTLGSLQWVSDPSNLTAAEAPHLANFPTMLQRIINLAYAGSIYLCAT